VSATLRFLRLLWIDVRRIHGYVPVVLVWVLTPFATYDYERFGIVLWADADRKLFATVLYLTSIGGGYGAWVAGRSRRRRLESQEATLPAPEGRLIVISLVAAGCWMTVAYLGAAAWFFQAPLREATWGAPNLALAIPVLGATWFAVGLGGVLGSLHRSLLIPPLVTAGIFGLQTWGQVDVSKRPTFRLIPMGYIEADRWWGELDNFHPRGLGAYSLTMIAWAVVAFAAAMLVRRISVFRTLGAVAALGIAIPAGQQTLAARVDTGADGRYESPVERVCETAPVTGIEICLHPAFSKLQDEVIALADDIYAPVVGLAGVPRQIYQPSDSVQQMRPDGVLELYLVDVQSGFLAFELVDMLLPYPDRPGATAGNDAAACVIMGWLMVNQPDSFNPRCDPSQPFFGSSEDTFDLDTRRAELEGVPEKIAAFDALTQEQQRAWLVANWNALRAGELTLEDLP
jgi:hypothetical protein